MNRNKSNKGEILFKKTLNKNIWSLKNKLKEEEGKDVVLFGYSSGGMIAHRIGEKSGYNSVSFGMSESPNNTMVGTLLSLTKNREISDIEIPRSGKNIIEGFSAIVPHTGDITNNTTQLKDIYSHMTIGKKEVVDEIVKEILASYNDSI